MYYCLEKFSSRLIFTVVRIYCAWKTRAWLVHRQINIRVVLMDEILSQYSILERLRYFLEPQDYINLLRSRNNGYRHKADLTDIKYCLSPVNFLFKSLDPITTWNRLYGCSFILYGKGLARLHDYLVGKTRGYHGTYDIILVIAFEDLRSYQRALSDTLNGLVRDIYDEIRQSIREQIGSLLPGAQSPHKSIVRLHLDLQVSDVDILSFFRENGSPEATRIARDRTPAIFVCSHAAEPFSYLSQALPMFSSCTLSVVLLGTLDKPTFIAVRKCHICLSSPEKVGNSQVFQDGIGIGSNTTVSSSSLS